MHPIVEHKLARLREWAWPDCVKVSPQPLDAVPLAEKFSQFLFNSITAHPSVKLDEALLGVDTGIALLRVLNNYREGSAVTAEERQLGQVLDHVARKYLHA